MDRQKIEAEELLYQEYSGKLRQIEEKRDDIEKEIRQVDELWDEDEIQRRWEEEKRALLNSNQ